MYFDIVKCPYCGHENDMSDGCTDLPDDNVFDHECTNCEKEFEVLVEFEPSYTASEIVYEECEYCKVKTRDVYKKGKVHPYPKKIKETKLCNKCWLKLVSEEFHS